MSNFGNGLTTSRDVFRNADEDSNIWAKKYPNDTIIASHIICDDIDINGGLLTTSAGGTVLELNGVPLGGGIATITGTAPINVTAGQNPIISLNNSGVVAGTYPLADVTVNNKGLITNINAGTIPPNDDWSNFPAQTAVNMSNFKITTLATPTVATDGATKGYVDGAITTAGAGFVNLLTNQTVGGIKTFTSIPVCATMPTANDQLANKQYVDSAVSADALANVLIAGNSAGANQINMNNNKIINCTNPTDPQDVATKNYVDSTAGPGLYLPLAGGTMANSSATINMNGADITGCGSLTAGGVSESAEFGTAITPMFGHNVYATNVSMNSYNPLSAMNFIGIGGVNINAPDEDINLNAGDINLTQTDVTSFMNLTATGSIVLGAGLGIDLTGGTTIQINSAGNVSIGSGNVLGADTEIEKIAFKDNEIYKVAGNADITIEDVASITNVGTAPNGAMLIQAEQNLTLNSTAGNVIVEGLTVNGTTISGANVIVDTAVGGDVALLTGTQRRLEIDGATNGNNTITNSGTGFTQINSALGGGSSAPILKLQNTNTTAGSGSVYVEAYKAKNVANGDNLYVNGIFGNRTSGAKLEMARIETTVNDATLNSEDVRMSFYVRDDGTLPANPQFDIHGNEGQINMRLPLDMNGNAITSSTGNLIINGPPTGANVSINALGSVSNLEITSGDVLDLRGFDVNFGTILQGEAFPGTYTANMKLLTADTRFFKPLNLQNQPINTSLGNINITNPVAKSGTTAGNINIQTTGAGDLTLRSSGGAGTGDVFIQSSDFINMEANGSILIEAGIATPGVGGITIQNTPPSGVVNNVFEASAVSGITTVRSAPDQAITLEGNSITLNGASMTSPSVGSGAGINLQIRINGTNYVIPLYNP